MQTLTALTTLAGIWLLAVTLPGPNFIVVSQHSLSDSRKSGLFIALGVSTAACVWAISSLIGLKALFEHANWLYGTIRLIGAIYLVYLGLKILFGSFQHQADTSDGNVAYQTPCKAYCRGLLTSFSNPKTAAFFGSIFVAVFPPQAPNWVFPATIMIVFSISVGWYSLVAIFFSLPRIRIVYMRFRKIMDRITGSLLILFARLATCFDLTTAGWKRVDFPERAICLAPG